MKKTLIILLALTFFGFGSSAMAEEVNSDPKEVHVTLTVADVFGFTVDFPKTDFGTLYPLYSNTGHPETGKLEGSIYPQSNRGAWSLAIQGNPFECGGVIMPSEPNYFKFGSWPGWINPDDPFVDKTPANGTFLFPDGAAVPTSETTFYESGPGEECDFFVPLTFNLYVQVPPEQKAGEYTATVIITMTEE